MKRKYLLFLIFTLTAGFFVFINKSELGSRISHKIQAIEFSLKSHPEYIEAPSQVSTNSVNLLTQREASEEPVLSKKTFSKPSAHLLNNIRHEYQTWNNCGPATLSMALSFYNFPQKQKDIAPFLKPDPEDKNVSPNEIVEYVKTQTSYKITYTFNADLLKIKLLNANDIPVIVETWYEPHPNDGMGHYLLIKGYDEIKKELYLYDSYRGPNITISEQKLDDDWKVFDRTLMAIYPPEKEALVQEILGDNVSIEQALSSSLSTAQKEIEQDQNDVFAWFNLGTTYSLIGKHQEASTAFDKARVLKLPWRMLWYQFSIFDSYLAVGRTQDVIDLTTSNLKQANNLEESLYYRAKAKIQQNKKAEAKIDLQNAIKFNKNYSLARQELSKL